AGERVEHALPELLPVALRGLLLLREVRAVAPEVEGAHALDRQHGGGGHARAEAGWPCHLFGLALLDARRVVFTPARGAHRLLGVLQHPLLHAPLARDDRAVGTDAAHEAPGLVDLEDAHVVELAPAADAAHVDRDAARAVGVLAVFLEPGAGAADGQPHA